MRPVGTKRMRTGAAVCAAVVAIAGCASAAATAPRPVSHPQDPARSCLAGSGWAAITLTNTPPASSVTVPAGAHVVVTVPRWGWGKATDVRVTKGGILRQECTVLLPDRGRRTIFLAIGSGRTGLYATVAPASDLMMPAWGGKVIVRAAQG